MKLKEITNWISRVLNIDNFDDVSNNGLQIASENDDVASVAFGVDASVAFLAKAAELGAQLAVVHHGISWGGGIKRVVDSEFAVISKAIKNNIALYAVHLPLDANEKYGNNAEIARALNLEKITPAFNYHGNVIGVTGFATTDISRDFGAAHLDISAGSKIGICSGGAGEFAIEAKKLACDVFITGECSWGEKIATENVNMKMICCGHYETETFGVKALASALKEKFQIDTNFVELHPTTI